MAWGGEVNEKTPWWPHQEVAFNETTRRIEAGVRSLCVTSPTGGGKSRMMTDIIEWALAKGWCVSLFTNRKMLTEQLIKGLKKDGVPFGVRAASFPEYHDHNERVQICSTATENSRVFQRGVDSLFPSELDIIDEPHMSKGEVLARILQEKGERGAVAVGYTATPLGIADMFPELVVAGKNSELRACGAHVPCHVYAPDEPDCSRISREKTGEYSYADIKKHIWTHKIFGRVLDHWRIYNPEQKPTILFAPGVKESIWFAERFEEIGIRAAHIDGNSVYLDGKLYRSVRTAREDIIGGVKDGSIKIVCNRFVMREGIDIPELYHCILATPIGSLLSYIQTVGRVVRAHPSLDHVILQDHGGNWWRHGSPNADRDWASVYRMPARVVTDLRLDRMREKKEPEPIHCPKCSAIRAKGPTCPKCGFEHSQNSRMVLQADGNLKTVEGCILKPRVVRMKPNTEQIWTQCYHRIKNSGGTFRQVEGLFFYENHYYPPRNMKFMPLNDIDLFRKVKDVPPDRLHGYDEAKSKQQRLY